MSVVLTIDGVDQALKVTRNTLRLSQTANGRSALSFAILSEDGSYRPSLDDEVILTIDGTRVAAGLIDQSSESGPFNGPVIETLIDVAPFEGYAERRYINEVIPAGTTLKTALTDHVLPYLEDYGVTLDPSQVDGPTLPELTFEYVLASEVLTRFATITASAGQPYVWEIDEFKVLRMVQPSTQAAPFDITAPSDELDGDVVVETTRENYANRIIVKVAPKQEPGRIESFEGDGVTDTFDLVYTPTALPGIIHRFESDGVTPAGGETFGSENTLDSDGSPVQWWYLASTNQIQRNAGVSEDGFIYKLTFDGIFQATAIAEDAGEIASVGVWEKVIVLNEVSSEEALQEIADAELAASLPVTTTIRYPTLTPGLKPGQQQHITVAVRDLDTDAVITDVVISEVGAQLLYHITARAEADMNLGGRRWQDDYLTWYGDKTGTGGSVTVGDGAIGQLGPAPPDESVQFNDSGRFGGNANFTFDKTATTVEIGTGHAYAYAKSEADNLLVGSGHTVDA